MTALRSALFQVYFALLSVVICLGWSPALLGPWRWSALGVRLWGKATLWGLRVICGLKYEVRGREHHSFRPAGHRRATEPLVVGLPARRQPGPSTGCSRQ